MGASFVLVATVLLSNAAVLVAPGTTWNTESAKKKVAHSHLLDTLAVTDIIWSHGRRKFIL